MYHQQSTDWWQKRTIFDITRNDLMMLVVWAAIIAVYTTSINWDRAFGKKPTDQVVAQKVAKK